MDQIHLGREVVSIRLLENGVSGGYRFGLEAGDTEYQCNQILFATAGRDISRVIEKSEGVFCAEVR